MSDLLLFGVLAVVVSALAWLAWWLLIASEGVYLGRRVVIWLYDLYASRYDDTKGIRKEHDEAFLSKPILDQIAPQSDPLMLDVATGTARLPVAMLNNSGFHGAVFGIDLSRRMLAHAAYKLHGWLDDGARPAPYTALIHAPGERLPFPDNTFDVVSCLEALEFMENPAAVIAELARVLRPGGLLCITTRISTRLMPGKTFNDEQMAATLEQNGFDNIEFDIWQADYTLVWAQKQGESDLVGTRRLTEVLRCPACGHTEFLHTAQSLTCSHCDTGVQVGDDGVVEMVAATGGH